MVSQKESSEMKKTEMKRFRDPVYGYIDIDKELIMQVVDTPAFQRLRDVTQTSYAPLYSSAVHNRFAHSLGVYHLGCRASQAFLLSMKERSIETAADVTCYMEVFKLACLLHDVGHAPFSHTLEDWYLEDGERDFLHNCLIELIEDESLEEEIKANSYKAAPHELMSAIVSLRFFSGQIEPDKRSFFARCITGYKYTKNMDTQKSVKNCLIELLNSKVIDVDKLDYLLRDSYMTGFDTVAIDYVRLLDNVCVFKDVDGMYRIVFKKSAISIIENVIYAHDAEKKWIQNHPVVKYEAYLINNIFEEILKNTMGTKVIPESVLTENGGETKNGKVRLLSDSDVICWMKKLENNSYVKEYYDRNKRRHPIWKTEAEFQAIFSGKTKALEAIGREFEKVKKNLNSLSLPFIINDKALKKIEKELEELKKEQPGKQFEIEKRKISIQEKEYHVKLMRILEEFHTENDVEFNFLIIDAEQFNSGFRKPEFGEIEIKFPELISPCKFKDVSNVLQSQQSKSKNFFYLYYERKDNDAELKIKNLIENLLGLADDIVSAEERLEQERVSKKTAERLK